MDENKDSVDDSQIKIKNISTKTCDTADCTEKPNIIEPASPSVILPETISKEMQKNISEYNDTLFWNIRC